MERGEATWQLIMTTDTTKTRVITTRKAPILALTLVTRPTCPPTDRPIQITARKLATPAATRVITDG